MDNITHSLIGAVLGQAGLKRKTGLGMPALIIAANLPDVDAPFSLLGIESLAIRRGLSHGPIALVVLPLALAGGLWWYDRWQARRGKRPEERLPVHFGWLLALCWLGWLTHLLFDWFNNYGIRLLEPFSSQWFYGDTLFIIDPWLMAALGAGIWFSRKRERGGTANWARPAHIAVMGGLAYIALNIGISRAASAAVLGDAPYPQVAVASPVPLLFWRREVLWRNPDGSYGTINCAFASCQRYPLTARPSRMTDPRIAAWSKQDRQAKAFLFWSRMPIAELHADHIILRDQRYMQESTARQFSVTIRAPK